MILPNKNFNTVHISYIFKKHVDTENIKNMNLKGVTYIQSFLWAQDPSINGDEKPATNEIFNSAYVIN